MCYPWVLNHRKVRGTRLGAAWAICLNRRIMWVIHTSNSLNSTATMIVGRSLVQPIVVHCSLMCWEVLHPRSKIQSHIANNEGSRGERNGLSKKKCICAKLHYRAGIRVHIAMHSGIWVTSFQNSISSVSTVNSGGGHIGEPSIMLLSCAERTSCLTGSGFEGVMGTVGSKPTALWGREFPACRSPT